MSILDSIISQARDVATDVGKRAGDVVEVSKLKLQAISLGSDIDKVYEKLGLMVYEMVKAGTANQGLVDECVAEIDTLKAELDVIRGKLDELHNVHRCDSCGNAVDIKAQFCPNCGALLHKPDPTADASDPNPDPEEEESAPAEEAAEEPAEEEEAPQEEPAAAEAESQDE